MNQDAVPTGVMTKGLPLPVALPSRKFWQSAIGAMNLRVSTGRAAFGTGNRVDWTPSHKGRETALGKPIGRPETR